MKKAGRLFSIVLSVIMILTSVGMVFADDAPPPMDDQSLLPPGGPYIPAGVDPVYTDTAIGFNWADVKGADKYTFELQVSKPSKGWVKLNTTQVTWTAKSPMPVPPTTITVTTKKPFMATDGPDYIYRWRVTAVNTDVGIDGAGTGQSTPWIQFNLFSAKIKDMYPQVTTTVTPYAYPSNIDQKKGEGTNLASPGFAWEIANVPSLTASFKIVVKQGKYTWTKTVLNSTAPCKGTDCYTDGTGFVPAAGSPAYALTKGIPANWEVTVFDAPSAAFAVPYAISATAKDIVEYNIPVADSFNVVTGARVTDTIRTNKPTFGWDRVPLPAKGVYQFVLEKNDYVKNPSEKKWVAAGVGTIDPAKTKIPGTTQLACTASKCYWRVAAPLSGNFEYRWNVRVMSGKAYGPWVDSGSFEDDRQTFYVPTSLWIPEITEPGLNALSADTTPEIQWTRSLVDIGKGADNDNIPDYVINLARVSPAPLTKGILNPLNLTVKGCGSDICSQTIDSANYPGVIPAAGLPWGIYQITVTPLMKLLDGQAYVGKPLAIDTSRFIIGPAAPAWATDPAKPVSYTGNTTKPSLSKLEVAFTSSTLPVKNVKYRILVAVKRGGLYQWIAIKTVSGKACAASTTPGGLCTLEFLGVNNPVTKKPFAGETYMVQIQQAELTSGKKFGPFGPLSPEWEGVLPLP